MYSESVLIRNSSGSGAHRVYRASARIPAASGRPITLVACALDRVQSIRDLAQQLAQFRAAQQEKEQNKRFAVAGVVIVGMFAALLFLL